MTTLTVKVPNSAEERIKKYILRIGGEVTVVQDEAGLLPIEEVEKSFQEVKKIREGKLPKISLKDALRD
ncbi:MAG: hypothetical protein WC380_07795 [Pedobacter sp.]|jgi:DNA-directed RNA polymerase subunit H (RpoH/RPB5)